ncbi:MAG: hypothetical protein U5O15_04240 [Candidatus Krumholzibacteriota bacterium]|nr:hypothetical protein [Candidatus Krumholzibacteriota bacterium]
MFLVCLGFIPGVNFAIISAAASIINIFLLVIIYLSSRDRQRAHSADGELIRRMYSGERSYGRGKILLFLVFFALCFAVFFEGGDISVDSDSLDHLSFIRRSLESGEILPGDSFYIDGDGKSFDPRKGIWHSALALLTYQSDADPVYLWRMLPSFLSFFVIISFFFFAVELLASTSLAVFAVLILLLFFRGEGLLWFSKIAYSRHIAQAILWAQAGLMLRQLKEYGNDRRTYIFLFLFAFAGAAVHVIFPVLLFLFLAGLYIFVNLPGGNKWKEKYRGLAAVQLAGAAIPLIFRLIFTTGKYNFIHSHRQGILKLTNSLVVIDPLVIVESLGIAVLFAIIISPFYFLVVWKRRRFNAVEILFILPVLLAITPFTATLLENYMGYLYFRILYAAPAACFLSFIISDFIRILFTGRSRMNYRDISFKRRMIKRVAASIVLILFVLFPIRYSGASFSEVRAEIVMGEHDNCGRYATFFDLMNRLIPEHSTILSDPVTSYLISGLTDHFVYVVSAQHESPADLKATERNRRARDVFCTPLRIENNSGWINKEGIDYILFDRKGAAKPDFYRINGCKYISKSICKFRKNPHFKQILQQEDFVLFKVSSDSIGYEPEEYTSVDTLDNDHVSISEKSISVSVGSGVILEAFVINEQVIYSGDSVSGTFWWSLNNNVEFGLPLMWSVRFDTQFPKGVFYRSWYSKQYRRWIERSNDTFYRYTVTNTLKANGRYPDTWKKGEIVRQGFSFELPEELKPGNYRVRVKVRPRSYLPNRKLSDYLSNKDSRHGVFIKDILVRKSVGKH